MTRIHRPARIIAPAPGTADEAGSQRARRFDYAALLRRRAPHAANPAGFGTLPDGHGTEDSNADTPSDTAGHDLPADPRRSTTSADSLADRIGSVSTPIVDAVYRQQHRFVELTARIAREIAAFCSNRAITRSGNWDVRLPLDQKVLPDTTLYLMLSPLCLQLRFDTQDPSSKQLLLQHSHLLDRELTMLLDAWGESRQVEITIW
ncbi:MULTISPECIES: type III secretion system protein SctP [unclassified Burkholderia]|uniref:type III secretion system protein SctP n=1 Tax=unclassified Burkholderia TaxID=2613784 RepID=UPI00214F8D60|nr:MULTISPECIES: type III secretion system protein SctP [unclassified Burkholderia]MCR4468329.1 type III secretion system protein SctP [Burkholderia sp. SCN-KJ]